MNRARISPLTARNAARGLSASRRPAMSAGRVVRPPGHEARAGHGEPRSGDQEPDHGEQEPGPIGLDLPAGGAWPADADEVGELADAGEQRDQAPRSGRAAGDVAAHAERGDLAPGAVRTAPPPRRRRDADRDEQDVGAGERQVGGEERLAGEWDLGHRRAEQEEQAEPESGHARGGGDVDSTAEITETCRGVAPTSRMAANRCSRRAAARRVAVPMKMSTGNSSAPATTARISSSRPGCHG